MAESSTAPNSVAPEYLTANVGLKLAGERFELSVTVPTAPVSGSSILPILHTLSGALEAQARANVERDGKRISCRQGCGACCRQVVPISEIEARRLAQLVDELPEPRRTVVRARFAAVVERLEQAGLLETLRHPEHLTESDRSSLGLAYFRLGLPCPFLESESCSIHPDRPLACREYLVTSPAANCAKPSKENIERVELPMRLSTILPRLDHPTAPAAPPWVPLILALELAETQPDLSSRRPGPEWMALLFEQLSGRPVPPSTV
jgi:Fe-S-cluster containining protein